MKGQAINGLHMVNIMATIKREINKTTATAKKSTSKRVVSNTNTFTLDEKKMVLNITIPVGWNKSHTGLKAKNVCDVPGKEYKKLSIMDDNGNEIYLFKTVFGYEPAVKVEKLRISKKEMSALSDDEQEMLKLLLKKMGK